MAKSFNFALGIMVALSVLTVMQANAQSIVNTEPNNPPSIAASNPAAASTGFAATGKITSMIFPLTNPLKPNATKVPYLLAGNFNLSITGEHVSLFNASFTMVLANGTDRHTHTFVNFKPSNATVVFSPRGITTINGTMDITKNGSIAWQNVTTKITIENSTVVRIIVGLGPAANHFIGQAIYGVIDSTPASTVTNSSNQVTPRGTIGLGNNTTSLSNLTSMR